MEKTEIQCRLCDKYGHPARNYRIRNFRTTPTMSYKDDDHVYALDRRFEPREGLLWVGTITRGVTTSSSAKFARSTSITSENEEAVRVQQTDTGPTISVKDARMSIQESHRGRTLTEVHYSVGNFETRKIGDSGDEVIDWTRKIM
jgi:hypothetical protein